MFCAIFSNSSHLGIPNCKKIQRIHTRKMDQFQPMGLKILSFRVYAIFSNSPWRPSWIVNLHLHKYEIVPFRHTCDISRFRRELPIWSLSSRSHARETKPPDERFIQCHFSRTVFQSEHYIVYGSIYLANTVYSSKVSDIYRSN